MQQPLQTRLKIEYVTASKAKAVADLEKLIEALSKTDKNLPDVTKSKDFDDILCSILEGKYAVSEEMKTKLADWRGWNTFLSPIPISDILTFSANTPPQVKSELSDKARPNNDLPKGYTTVCTIYDTSGFYLGPEKFYPTPANTINFSILNVDISVNPDLVSYAEYQEQKKNGDVDTWHQYLIKKSGLDWDEYKKLRSQGSINNLNEYINLKTAINKNVSRFNNFDWNYANPDTMSSLADYYDLPSIDSLLWDISEDITPDLLSFTYDDKETNSADEITLTLKDDEGKWASSWQPNGGDIIRATIIQGETTKSKKELYCGEFYVDKVSCKGSPRTFELSAVSIPLYSPIRKKIRSEEWVNITLEDLAKKVLEKHPLTLSYREGNIDDVKNEVFFDKIKQDNESDLKFLSRVCNESGFQLKVTERTVVMFDTQLYFEIAPSKTLTLNEDDIISWSFEKSQSDVYKSCKVSWRDPTSKDSDSSSGYNMNLQKEGGTPPQYDVNLERVKSYSESNNAALNNYVATDPDYIEDSNAQDYVMKKRASSKKAAKTMAINKLRELNSHVVTGDITLIGDVSFKSGIVIWIKNFGSFDGLFVLESVSHSITTSGYTVGLTLRRIRKEYNEVKADIPDLLFVKNGNSTEHLGIWKDRTYDKFIE